MKTWEEEVWLNGRPISDWDVCPSMNGAYSSGQRSYTVTQNPQINGTTLQDDGFWTPVEVTYKCWIADGDFKTKLRQLSAFVSSLIGRFRLEDTAHPARYMRGYQPAVSNISMSPAGVYFDLTMQRDPQIFLTDGELPITSTADRRICFRNPTEFPAYPLICCAKAGTLEFWDGENSRTLKLNADGMTIDCETQEAYSSDTEASLNDKLVVPADGSFPRFEPARRSDVLNNYIFPTSGIGTITVTPRWFEI